MARTFYLPVLTGLSAVMAGLVFLQHYPCGAAGAGSVGRAFRPAYCPARGVHGLLLSGFLIVLRYDNGSANFRPCGGWRPYLQARLTQVYPLFAGLLRENSWFRRLLSSRAMQALGRSSYALYLLPAGPLSFWVYERLPDYLPLRLLAVQLVSYLAYRFVEEPLTQWLRPRPG